MVEMSMIRLGNENSNRARFGPFTSVISCAALIGIYIGMASIILDNL